MLLPGPRCLLLLAAAVTALATSGTATEPRHPAPRAPSRVSVGQPVTPRPVTVPGPGTLELRAASPTRDGRPAWVAVVLSTPGADARDVCVATGLAGRGLGEANTGAVFDDEVGENILLSSHDEIVRRFGAPAAMRTEHGRRCAYYEVVGRARDDWRFCFAADGRMLSAGGNSAPP